MDPTARPDQTAARPADAPGEEAADVAGEQEHGGRALEHPDPMAPGTSVDDDEEGWGGDAVEPNEPA